MRTEDPTTIISTWLIDIDAKGNAKIEIKNVIENQSTESIPLNKPYKLIFPDSDIIKENPTIKTGNADTISLLLSHNEISTVIRGNLEPHGSANSKLDFSIKFPLVQQFANIYDGVMVINKIFFESAFYSPDILIIEFRFPNPKNIFKYLNPKYNHKPKGTEEDRTQKGLTIVRFSQGIDRGDAIYPFLVDFMVIPKFKISIIIALLVSIVCIILTFIFYKEMLNFIIGFILSIIAGVIANYLTKKVLHE